MDFDRLLQTVVDADASDAELDRLLESATGTSVSVREIAPTLEDVFVRLTALQAGAAVAARAVA